MSTVTYVVALAVGAWAAWWYHRAGRPVARSMGLRTDRRSPVDVLVGLVIPFVAISLVFVVERLLGAIDVTSGAGLTAASFASLLGQVLFYAAVEELLFRVLLLSGVDVLLRNVELGRWIAVAVTALVFGAVHLSNPNGTVIGAFGTALGGVIYGVAFLTTRSIWLPLALHASWNASQALWGFPVSGNTEWPGFVTSTSTGNELLNGGAYGPEAGLPGMLARVLILVLVLVYVKRRWPDGDLRTLRYAPEPSRA